MCSDGKKWIQAVNPGAYSVRRSAQCSTELEHIDNEIKRLFSSSKHSLMSHRHAPCAAASQDEVDVIGSQKLFTVYTYPSEEFDFPSTSIFYQTEMPNRVSLFDREVVSPVVQAEITLLWKALQDPLSV